MKICSYHKCSKCLYEVWLYIEAEVYCAKCKRPMKKTCSPVGEQENPMKEAA